VVVAEARVVVVARVEVVVVVRVVVVAEVAGVQAATSKKRARILWNRRDAGIRAG
jgi:hypothetical protein